MLNRVSKTIFPDEVTYTESIGYHYDFAHNAGSDEILIGVFDNTGKLMNTNGLFTKLDDNTLRVYFPDATNYTWTVYVFYDDDDTIENAPKKRLFEQPTIPSSELDNYLDYKLAMGGPNMQTYNMTLEDFKSWAQSTLDTSLYLLKGNNLSDVLDPTTARNNLNVYSKDAIDAFVGSLAPASGYVQTVSAWHNSSTPVTPTPSVTSSMDSGGVAITMTFATSSTYSNRNIGYISMTAISGFTLDVAEQVFPVFAINGSGSRLGQLRVVPSATSTGVVCTFYLSLSVNGSSDCSAVFHINVNKQ